MYTYKLFHIEALTNTHVGSGEETLLGAVDNFIQRDPVTHLPIFHASGLKGALCDHCRENGMTSDKKEWVFGSEVRKKAKVEEKIKSMPGNVLFFEARLLLLPLRASKGVFFWATSAPVIREYFEAWKLFLRDDSAGFEGLLTGMQAQLCDDEKDFLVLASELKDLEIEDFEAGAAVPPNLEDDFKLLARQVLKVPAKNLAVFKADHFQDICESRLPVIARNEIKEDGTSGNLWYEEVLPRRSRLWFLLGCPSGQEDKGFSEWVKLMADNGRLVQFGANKSVGYGVCRVSHAPKLNETKENAKEEK